MSEDLVRTVGAIHQQIASLQAHLERTRRAGKAELDRLNTQLAAQGDRLVAKEDQLRAQLAEKEQQQLEREAASRAQLAEKEQQQLEREAASREQLAEKDSVIQAQEAELRLVRSELTGIDEKLSDLAELLARLLGGSAAIR